MRPRVSVLSRRYCATFDKAVCARASARAWAPVGGIFGIEPFSNGVRELTRDIRPPDSLLGTRQHFDSAILAVVQRVDPHVAADGPARLRQPLQERPDEGLISEIVRTCRQKDADASHPLALLRARRERPRATEQRDEIAPLHSITSLARAVRAARTSLFAPHDPLRRGGQGMCGVLAAIHS